MSDAIYLDNHATTVVDRRVIDRMVKAMAIEYGNAHSKDHAFGDLAKASLDSARASIANAFGLLPGQVIFTSGATESINIAIKGFCRKRHLRGLKTIISVSNAEHIAVLQTCETLQSDGVATLRWLPTDGQGHTPLDEIRSHCKSGTDLLCIMAANNEIGTINPVQAIGDIADEFQVPLFCDGTQLAGKCPINLSDSHIDYFCLSGHKIYGPKGVGALLVRDPYSIASLSSGGPHEFNLRAGTVNIPGIIGLAYSCHLRTEEMDQDELAIGKLRDALQAHIQEHIPNVVVNGDLKSRLAGNLHFCIKGVPNDAVIARVRHRIAISTGSACTDGAEGPSHVLRAIGLSEDLMLGALRIGIGKFNTMEEIRIAGEVITSAVLAIIRKV